MTTRFRVPTGEPSSLIPAQENLGQADVEQREELSVVEKPQKETEIIQSFFGLL